MNLIIEAVIGFLLGMTATLTSLRLLPLYPNFLFNLGDRFKEDPDEKTYFMFSLLVVAGVLTFMYSIGLLFMIMLQSPAAVVVSSVIPAVFGFLLFGGVLMVVGIDVSTYIPDTHIPDIENPVVNAYAFGLVFGAALVPYSPVFLAIFFAKSLLSTGPLETTVSFLAFGLGIAYPLMVFSVLSVKRSRKVIQIFANRQELVKRTGGLLLIAVSLYYLMFVL